MTTRINSAKGTRGKKRPPTVPLPRLDWQPDATLCLQRRLRRAPGSFEDLLLTLETRPELSRRVLREANSVLNAPAVPIRELSQAVLRLGENRVRKIALGVDG